MTVTWREDEPRLTAADVDAAAFPRTPWGRRGYDEDAVNAFLDRVHAELIRYANETTGLREETARLRRRFVTSQRGGEWMADASEAHAMAVAVASEGQAYVDRIVADAQEYCARLTQDATERREAMLAEAEQVLADARTQAAAAAAAAMDEPVPDQLAEPLRAARASDAYGRKVNEVGLGGSIAMVEALLKLLTQLKMLNEAGDGHADALPERAR